MQKLIGPEAGCAPQIGSNYFQLGCLYPTRFVSIRVCTRFQPLAGAARMMPAWQEQA